MGYRDNKAAGRKSPAEMVNPLSGLTPKNNAASNQEQFTNVESLERTLSPNNGGKYDIGTVIKIGPNTKGTGVTKRTTTIALAKRDMSMPATEDVDGNKDRSTSRTAAKS